MSEQYAVQARGVVKRYGRHAPTLVDIDLDVERGTILTLAGSNGSGKSTLLRCIAGLATFDGLIEVCGRTVSSDRAFLRSVGYLPQAVMLPTQATVNEALAFFARLRGVNIGSAHVPTGFLPPARARIGTLSGGQRQRLTLAIALLGEPEVLLLDEPVANLDASGREAVWDMLRDLRRGGTTVLIASPSPVDLAGVGDRTIVLHEGRVVETQPESAMGSAAELAVESRVEVANG